MKCFSPRKQDSEGCSPEFLEDRAFQRSQVGLGLLYLRSAHTHTEQLNVSIARLMTIYMVKLSVTHVKKIIIKKMCRCA